MTLCDRIAAIAGIFFYSRMNGTMNIRTIGQIKFKIIIKRLSIVLG